MAKTGEIYNAIQEMKRMKIEIMDISEMRWPGSGDIEKEGYRIFYSGSAEGRFERGVGVITSKNVGRSVTNFIPNQIEYYFCRYNQTRSVSILYILYMTHSRQK